MLNISTSLQCLSSISSKASSSNSLERIYWTRMSHLKSTKKQLYLITSTKWRHIYIIILTLDGIIIDNTNRTPFDYGVQFIVNHANLNSTKNCLLNYLLVNDNISGFCIEYTTLESMKLFYMKETLVLS